MDNLDGISDSKLPKRSVLSPIQNFGTQNPYYHYKTPLIDEYATKEDPNFQFLRDLQSTRSLSSSALSIGERQSSIGYKYHRNSVTRPSENAPRLEPSIRSRSPLVFGNSTVNVDEDVLVMDGVVVKNLGFDRGLSSSSSVTESGDSSSSSSPGRKNYMKKLCPSENFRYVTSVVSSLIKGPKVSQFPYKSKHEAPSKSSTISTSVHKTPPIKSFLASLSHFGDESEKMKVLQDRLQDLAKCKVQLVWAEKCIETELTQLKLELGDEFETVKNELEEMSNKYI